MKSIMTLFVAAVFLLFGRGIVVAATVSFNASSTVGTGSPFPVEVLLTAPSSVNAFTIEFDLSPGLTVSDFSDGNSIVSMWVDRLHKTTEGSWSASGIIPGGFLGKDSRVLTLYIEGDTSGTGSISLGSSSQAYGNTAITTPEKITSVGGTFTLVSGKLNPVVDYSSDNESPESFVPVLGKVPIDAGDVWAVTFTTQDKGSGVSYYEVAESARKSDAGYGSLAWVTAESPYVLRDQDLSSWIYVKAVDKKGLVTIQSLAPHSSWFKEHIQYILIALACVACLYVLFKFISRRRS